jgi:hypothetical protein
MAVNCFHRFRASTEAKELLMNHYSIVDLEETVVPSTYGEGPLPGLIVLGIFIVLA